MRFLCLAFCIIPIKKNRIVLSSFNKRFACNQKYLFLELYEKHKDSLEFIFVIDKESDELNRYKNIKKIKFLSFQFFYYVMTSKVYVSGATIEPFLPKRKNQFFVCTWHGTAYKSLSPNSNSISKGRIKLTYDLVYVLRRKSTNFILSPNYRFIKDIAQYWRVDESVFLKIGYPRNDLFFKENNDKLISKIKEKLKIDKNLGVVLYAPTFRGNFRNTDDFAVELNIEETLKSLEKRFNKKFIFLFRGHHLALGKFKISESVINVDWYEDMQELLLISDVLITDYSSSSWDFYLTKKPVFLYVPDLDDYIKNQGLCVTMEEMPSLYALSNEEMQKNIEKFNYDDYLSRIEKHFNEMGSYENGTASRQLGDLIMQNINNGK
ncbi:CDP-glycerol glycerophosphotransferase family protein [Campylobacter sp. VBCF_02 NA5]|nr:MULTISPECIES: CDP-glycerol glycerophosphotransferase family protein [unclassified Campylobacter]MDA3054604.1 CDP-glycerol glycerophosphotransferase family protein [Campylobacter sp. VBCF_07 NA4]MDA3060612.1 CDP-glycerol glycerophosphotransferase family protein [Campylobacter sp. VBCF_02 NA5]MDA3070122.1 CDP-glycerol glycerophosphotransferase family protein [Campylobacter sp. VBCF_08 NA3]WBR55117.1 CDP-glycerol glycerophosphotransferase family protein [Campylobacter sp. VBCF_01 NA2]